MLSRKASVGAFLIGGIVLFGVGLFLIGNRQKVFSRGFEIYSNFGSVSGLVTGADVRVSGLQAGELLEIQVPSRPSGQYRLKLRLDQKVHPLIRQDSVATIQSEGLVGDKFLEIDKGSDNSPECASGATIQGMDPFDFSDLMQEARGLLDNTNQTIESAGEVADNVNQVLTEFLARGRNGKNGPEELNQTVVSAQKAMNNLAEDTEAIQHNFLLRGFFNKRGYYNLGELSPVEYRSSKFVTSHEAKRVWLNARELFSRSARAGESLTAKGREQLDQAMSAFVPDLPNSPIVVEGYADQGSPDEEFRESQQRAALVQQYLVARFQLNPKLVGSIPLGDSPPKSTGKADWSGVSLVLLP
ncbi:MAG TPA: MlaD family protein [Bryobacteraceae bacterium]|jgi:outer membrane protein OmpA-like peptidoglycan-associated protein